MGLAHDIDSSSHGSSSSPDSIRETMERCKGLLSCEATTGCSTRSGNLRATRSLIDKTLNFQRRCTCDRDLGRAYLRTLGSKQHGKRGFDASRRGELASSVNVRQKRRRDTPPSSPPSTAARRRRDSESAIATRSRPGAWLVAAAVAFGAVFAWYAKRPPRTEAEARARLAAQRPAPSALNVVVVTLDTTRADRLGCYGFRGVETPNIDALAREGVVFEHATATVPAHLPLALVDLHGPRPAAPRRARQRRLLPRRREGDARRAARRTQATRPARSSAAWVLESQLGPRARASTTTPTRSSSSKYKVVSLGTVQKPGDEVMDGRARAGSRR